MIPLIDTVLQERTSPVMRGTSQPRRMMTLAQAPQLVHSALLHMWSGSLAHLSFATPLVTAAQDDCSPQLDQSQSSRFARS